MTFALQCSPTEPDATQSAPASTVEEAKAPLDGWIDLQRSPFREDWVGGVLRIGIMPRAPRTLNPLVCDYGEWLAFHRPLLNPTLLTEGYDQHTGDPMLEPCMAESLPVFEDSADGPILVFRLRPGLTWSQGDAPVTSEDYAAAFRLIKADLSWAQRWRGELDEVLDVRVRDERTVVVLLTEKRPGLVNAVGRFLPHVPAHRAAEDASSFAIQADLPTSGPYEILDASPTRLRLALRERYRRERHPALAAYYEVLEYHFGDTEALVERHKSGELDITAGTRGQIQKLSGQGGTKVYAYDIGMQCLLVWSNRDPKDRARPHPFLGDAEVRIAFAMLLDRSRIGTEALRREVRLVSSPWPPEHMGTAQEIALRPYDPKAAAALLDARGWRRGADGFRERAGQRMQLEIAVADGNPALGAISLRVAEALRQGGVDAKVVALPTAEWQLKAEAHELEVTSFFVRPNHPTEEDPFTILHSSQRGPGRDNWAGLADPTLDDLLVRARSASDLAERKRLREAIHRRWHELEPYTSMGIPRVELAVGPKVANVRIHRGGPRLVDLVAADRFR